MANFTALHFGFVLCVAIAFSGCGKSEKHKAGAQRYDARGIVRGVAPDHSTIDVEHEAIPGFMPSMTMPFAARDRNAIAGLRTGDAISFRIDVTDKDFWIADVKKIALEDVRLAKPTPTSQPSRDISNRLREGDVMPVFDLTNEAGKPVNVETFRGRPWVLTFVFTRCPMPNFCPRMSKNFSELQNAIRAANGPVAQTRLLSITIDPQFDTPAVLKEYAQHEGADPKVWTFATGAPAEIDGLAQSFAVYRQNEGGTINHGLTTALIDHEGKIVKIWRGNGWTPREVVESLNSIDHGASQ